MSMYTIYLKGMPSCARTETNKHDLQTFNKMGTFLMFPELGFISLQKSNPKTDSKGKEVKNNGKSHNDAGEADSSVAVSSTKTVNAPKSSKRGRGRSRK